MDTEVKDDGCLVVTKGCEVSTGGMAVVIGCAVLIGLACGVLLTNAYKALDFTSDVYKNKNRVVQINAMNHEGHEYLFLTENGREDVFGLCHSPKCKCYDLDEEYLHRSLEGLKYGMSMMGQYLQSATEQTVNEARKSVSGTNATQVSVVPTFQAGRLVNQHKAKGKGFRCDADGKPNPKGKYVRKELSTSKVVDASELGNWKSGQSAPKVKANLLVIGQNGDIQAVLKKDGKEERAIYKADHSDVQALEKVEEDK